MTNVNPIINRQTDYLIHKYNKPIIIVSFTNVFDDNELQYSAFLVINNLVYQQLLREKINIICIEDKKDNGCETYYCVDASLFAIKNICQRIVDCSELKNYFSLNVIDDDGRIINENRHEALAVGDIKDLINEELYLKSIVNDSLASYVASFAVRSLLYEVSTSPKPGLVDRYNSGKHKDMNYYSFLNSASVLYPYFEKCFLYGKNSRDSISAFDSLRWPGMMAEGKMFASTNGSNTHKGAIFSLGIICGALGRLEIRKWNDSNEVLKECSLMTKGLTNKELSNITIENAKTSGQVLYAKYGIVGARGQAEDGFPIVKKYGLPILENGLAAGKGFDEAGSAALLSMMVYLIDTNIVSRSDMQTQNEVSLRIANMLKDNPYPDIKSLCQLDKELTEMNISPGGSADLLSVCYMLYFLKNNEIIF